MEIDWRMLQGESIPNALNTGIALGQRNALMRRDLDLEEQALSQRQLETKQGQARQQQQELSEAHQRLIVTGARLIQQIQPRDQAGWDQVLGAAAQAGLDMSEVPPQFDPNYAAQVVQAARAIEEHTGGEQFTLGEGQARYDSQGNVVAQGPRRRHVIPVTQGGGVYIEDDAGEGNFQPLNPDDEWEYEGGPSQPGSGNFP